MTKTINIEKLERKINKILEEAYYWGIGAAKANSEYTEEPHELTPKVIDIIIETIKQVIESAPDEEVYYWKNCATESELVIWDKIKKWKKRVLEGIK